MDLEMLCVQARKVRGKRKNEKKKKKKMQIV